MTIDLYTLISENVILLLFLVLAIGFTVGKIRLAGVKAGSTIGVLIAGLVFGHFGFKIDPMIGSIGFSLFIFSVGLQAGPSFFSVLMRDGPKYLALAVVVAAAGLGTAVLLAQVMGFDPGLGAGMLAGALTSTPSLAGAQDAYLSGLGNLRDTTLSVEQAIQNVNVGYALTYLGGTAGVILFVTHFPRLMGIDIKKEANRLAKERGLLGKRKTGSRSEDAFPIIRAYRVLPETAGKTLRQRAAEFGNTGNALRIRRGETFLDPAPELVLEENDVVSVVAPLSTHEAERSQLGEEVLDATLLNYQITTKEIVVLNDSIVGKQFQEQELISEFGCFANGITRSGIDLPISAFITLQRGDRVQVTGEESRLAELAEKVGYVEEEVEETDLLTVSIGVVIGVLVGLVVLKIGNISIGLGTAGGLLIMGIVLGYMSSLNPTFGRVPHAARYILMELGLMFFMAAIGINAGAGVVEAFAAVGPSMIACGLAVTFVSALGGYFFGTLVLKLNPALLLGSVTGAMTSTPALNILNEETKSAVPALGYSGTYTIANVLLTFAGTVMAML
jgi:putative transport protein